MNSAFDIVKRVPPELGLGARLLPHPQVYVNNFPNGFR